MYQNYTLALKHPVDISKPYIYGKNSSIAHTKKSVLSNIFLASKDLAC